MLAIASTVQSTVNPTNNNSEPVTKGDILKLMVFLSTVVLFTLLAVRCFMKHINQTGVTRPSEILPPPTLTKREAVADAKGKPQPTVGLSGLRQRLPRQSPVQSGAAVAGAGAGAGGASRTTVGTDSVYIKNIRNKQKATLSQALNDIANNKQKNKHWRWYHFPGPLTKNVPVSQITKDHSFYNVEDVKTFIRDPELIGSFLQVARLGVFFNMKSPDEEYLAKSLVLLTTVAKEVAPEIYPELLKLCQIEAAGYRGDFIQGKVYVNKWVANQRNFSNTNIIKDSEFLRDHSSLIRSVKARGKAALLVFCKTSIV